MTTTTEKLYIFLPKNLNTPTAIGILETLIKLFEGERVHLYDGWSVSGGWKNLKSNRSVTLANNIVEKAGFEVRYGNDAPKGGRAGDYMYLARKNQRATVFLKAILHNHKV